MQDPAITAAIKEKFPFGPEDIESWTLRNHDGTTIRMVLYDHNRTSMVFPGVKKILAGPPETKQVHVGGFGGAQGSFYSGSISKWCSHHPAPLPVFSGVNKAGKKIDLYIADAAGTRAHWKEMDFVLDGGDVLGWFELDPIGKSALLSGDTKLALTLAEHVAGPKTTTPAPNVPTRVLKIKWADRQAPDLEFTFWPALLEQLHGKVLCNCQGGHGRSGTALTILMMLMSTYDALDALTHLRAIHCPRAIESVVQHAYIDKFATWLGRTANAKDAHAVKSYRARFLDEVKAAEAGPYQARLKAAAGTLEAEKVREKDDEGYEGYYM